MSPAAQSRPVNDHPDPFAWLEAADVDRTHAWLAVETARVEAAFPAEVLRPLELALRRSMAGRTRLSAPIQRAGRCYRYDAAAGTWLTSSARSDRRLGSWHRPRFAVASIDPTLSSNFVVCPFPYGDQSVGERAMVRFGTTDAVESVEVDLSREAVVTGGLHVPRSVHELTWDGPDAVLVSRRVEESGVVRWIVDRFKRGEPRPVRVHEFPPDRVVASMARDISAETARYLVVEWLDYQRRAYAIGHHPNGADASDVGSLVWAPVLVPAHVRVQLLGDVALLMPLAPWQVADDEVPAGTLLAAPVSDLLNAVLTPRVVWRPADRERTVQLACGRTRAMLTVQDDHGVRLLAINPRDSDASEVTRANANATVRAAPVDVTDAAYADEFWVTTSGPVSPPALIRVDATQPRRRWLVDESTGTFRHRDFVVHLRRTTQGSGTPVQYTVIAPAGMPLDGDNPTVLSGYGGFSVPEHIDYLSQTGPTWLDRETPDGRRCVFVFAHVGDRGGAQLAPWERLAGSVDRFLTVADQLTRDGVTRPGRLGVMGESHGGLLVMNAMLTKPSAFGAVVCRSAVLDLLRYPELDGAAWAAEYGDPHDPADSVAMRKVSPYHRINPGVRYPPALLWSSTNDDRVSPAHSRKTAALLRAAGGAALYLQNPDGGHDSLGSTPVGVHGLAVTAAFLWHHLVDGALD